MIFIKLFGRLGNQMFQYAFGKILEKERRIPVYFLCNKHDFALHGFDDIQFIDSSNWFMGFIEKLISRFKIRYREYLSCLEEVDLNSISNYTLVLGYFQSSNIFENNKLFVKSLFNVSPKFLPPSNACAVHIRRGDYLDTYFKEIESHAIIPRYWFIDQLDFVSKNYGQIRFFVIGDDPTYIQEFCNESTLDLKFCTQDVMSDFLLLMFSKYLIISNSSFAWWGAFLNVHEDAFIIAPKFWVGFHVSQEYPKGIMNSRFTWR
jgi:hypothetical protein